MLFVFLRIYSCPRDSLFTLFLSVMYTILILYFGIEKHFDAMDFD
jgi:hypothetical protein